MSELKQVEKQAQSIRDYWKSQGETVKVWVAPESHKVNGKNVSYWAVKTNLVNGIPKK